MKKILLFTDSLGAGGAQHQLVGLAVFLQRAGYAVKVCTYHNFDFYKSILYENQVANELIPCADNSKKRILAVSKYFKRENPDWVIAYQETPSLLACVAKIMGRDYRLMVSERNTTQKIGMNERVRFFLYRWADAVVPNSYAQSDFLLSYYPWMKSKLTTISNFVDLERFVFSSKHRKKQPLIVVAASIWPPKNTVGLIQAVKILKDRRASFRIEWYGISDVYNDYLDQSKKLIKELELEDYINLLPKSKQIQEKYKECDYFCLPSFYEGTPNVICEAMSCGRPIICSKVCDNPVYVAEDENGFLFDPKSPVAIADTIQRALQISDEKYLSYCGKSREKAERLLSKKFFVDKYITIIEGR